MESKFVIVTTLCYVGIFSVIFFVCCCACTRHRKKGNRRLRLPQRSSQTNRRFYRPVQPPEYNTPSTPVTYGGPRGDLFAEATQIRTDGNTCFQAPQRNDAFPRNNFYPIVNVGHHPNPVFTGYLGGNLYPSTNVTGTHVVQITTCGETNANRTLQRLSDENGSEASQRFGEDDGAQLADIEDKNSVSITNSRKQSLSINSEREPESDVSSSQASHFQEISL